MIPKLIPNGTDIHEKPIYQSITKLDAKRGEGGGAWRTPRGSILLKIPAGVISGKQNIYNNRKCGKLCYEGKHAPPGLEQIEVAYGEVSLGVRADRMLCRGEVPSVKVPSLILQVLCRVGCQKLRSTARKTAGGALKMTARKTAQTNCTNGCELQISFVVVGIFPLLVLCFVCLVPTGGSSLAVLGLVLASSYSIPAY